MAESNYNTDIFEPLVSAQSGDSTQRSTPIVQRSLEELFLKTETKPHIYYLPLTEEQVGVTPCVSNPNL